ncbi:MAG: hypothetical protein O7D29_09825 [Gemmatimonadetes bacterium]|nr:hypothetical protein [Gemmatimonadota bacterium]
MQCQPELQVARTVTQLVWWLRPGINIQRIDHRIVKRTRSA